MFKHKKRESKQKGEGGFMQVYKYTGDLLQATSTIKRLENTGLVYKCSLSMYNKLT